MKCDQRVTCVVCQTAENFRRLECNFDPDQNERKCTQVLAKICVFLRLRLAKRLQPFDEQFFKRTRKFFYYVLIPLPALILKSSFFGLQFPTFKICD